MAVQNLSAVVGVYVELDDALEDYEGVKRLHADLGLTDVFDAAVIDRDANGNVKTIRKHESPVREGALAGATIGLAAGLAIAALPAVALGGALLAGTAAGGAIVAAVAGHVEAGMKRTDLEELGSHLGDDQSALVVVAPADVQAEVEAGMTRAARIETRSLQADRDAIDEGPRH